MMYASFPGSLLADSAGLLGLLFFAHGLADFVLQPAAMARAKALGRWQGFAGHGLVLLVLTVSCTLPYRMPGAWMLWVALPVLHVALDVLKQRALGSLAARWGPAPLAVFVVDQVLHAIITIAVWAAVVGVAQPGWLQELLQQGGGQPGDGHLPGRLLALVQERADLALGLLGNAYVYAVFAAGYLVQYLLQAIPATSPAVAASVEELMGGSASRVIGLLERALVITLVAVDALPAVALVLTAKSIARYPSLREAKGLSDGPSGISPHDALHFQEYYLVGTLASVLLGILGGLVARLAVKGLALTGLAAGPALPTVPGL
ncbi:MAG: DUF3307 domain-containing protein [Firmicutes bacterium]|nr:DUF3307 domain-containing protein [Bacillota bacterium]